VHVLTVHDLLVGKLPHHLRDSVYWFAKRAIQADDSIDLHVDNHHGLVAQENVASQLGLPTLDEVAFRRFSRKWNLGDESVLVSSGSFLWINEKLIVTQRTSNTKYDPSAWTSPAGRCDDTPYRTAIKETIEEISIESLESQKRWLPEIASRVTTIESNHLTYQTETKFPPNWGLCDRQLTTVRMFIDNVLVEESKLWMMFSEQFNTFEFRLPICATLKGDLQFSNPEFQTSVKALGLKELRGLKNVPALRRLLEESNKNDQ
jgi:8-oxo-dGTP pyrophosphatase MutT (NUDIX family)